MAYESKTPDDNKPRLHAWTTPKHDRYQLVSDSPCTRAEAIRILRQSPPKELGDATELQLADYENESAPARQLGTVRARYNMGDMMRSQMGMTFHVPLSRINR